MKRPLLVVGLAALGSSLLLPSASAAPTLGPTRTAWYDASYPTTTPAPPAPPVGVAEGDLVVSGTTISTSVLPVTSPAGPVTLTRATALSAVSFTIPAGASAATFTLTLAPGLSTAAITGGLPTGVTPVACPTTSSFVAGGHQAFDRAPSYDCSGRTSVGSLSADRKSVTFSDIAAVARGKSLSFVVLPGTVGLDRLVFEPPTSKALTLLSFDTAPVFTPGGTTSAPAPVLPLVPPVVSTPAALPAAPTASLPPLAAGPPSPGAASAPVVQVAPTAAAPVPLASKHLSDHPVQVEVLGGLVLLLSGAAFLALTDRRKDEGPEWGVGRHRAVRAGRAPAL